MLDTGSLKLWGAAISLAGLVACSGGESGAESEQEDSNGAVETAAETSEAVGMATEQMELPEGVTSEMVEQGSEIFAGAGLCYVCHGADGKGAPGLGADLTDGEWLHSDGSYESIIETTIKGVSGEESTSGTPMPPKGGSGITDDQVGAVAAYVYTLRGGE